jgi:hypothetical protein
MRNFSLTVAVVVASALLTGAAIYRFSCDATTSAAVRDGDAMKWLRSEFQLTDEQYAAIVYRHEVHGRACAQHCADIMDARLKLAAARARQADGAEAAAATAELRRVESLCKTSVEDHVRQVAALMAPEQGRRYLSLVLPRLAKYDASSPPNVRLDN